MELLEDGESCSRDTLNIMDLDTISVALTDSGDDDACRSGNCQCGTCTSGVMPTGGSCKASSECDAGDFCFCPSVVCLSTNHCLGSCQEKRPAGGVCNLDEHGACISNNCKCERCTDQNGRLSDGSSCSEDSDCLSDSYCDCDGAFCGVGTVNCNGKCKKKEDPGGSCAWDDNDECKFGNCKCGICTEQNGRLSDELSCSADSDCLHDSFCDCPATGCGIGTEFCYGTCKKKRAPGGWCDMDDNDECQYGNCKCSRCTDQHGGLPEGHACSANSDCARDMHCDCNGGFCGTGGHEEFCFGTCKPKKGYKGSCNVDGDCASNKCTCGKCANEQKKMGKDEACVKDGDCVSNSCTTKWTCNLPFANCGPHPCGILSCD